jgi:hypothetical protein
MPRGANGRIASVVPHVPKDFGESNFRNAPVELNICAARRGKSA